MLKATKQNARQVKCTPKVTTKAKPPVLLKISASGGKSKQRPGRKERAVNHEDEPKAQTADSEVSGAKATERNISRAISTKDKLTGRGRRSAKTTEVRSRAEEAKVKTSKATSSDPELESNRPPVCRRPKWGKVDVEL